MINMELQVTNNRAAAIAVPCSTRHQNSFNSSSVHSPFKARHYGYGLLCGPSHPHWWPGCVSVCINRPTAVRKPRCPSKCAARSDHDHVSILSADEQVQADEPPTKQNQQDDAQPASMQLRMAADPAPPGASASSGTPFDSSHSRHDFLISAQELCEMVQAAVDSSQGPAADNIIAVVTSRVVIKQQQRQARRAVKHPSASLDKQFAGSSSGSVVFDGSSRNGSGVKQQQPQASSLALAATLATALRSNLQYGLSGDATDAASRRAAYGSNSLAAATTSSFWQLLLEAASDSTLLLLLAAGAVSLGLSAATGKEAADFIDGAAILASVAICANVTAVTNYQKEAKFRQLNTLKENIPVRVVRGGVEVTLSCFDLLVGDVLLVEAGDILPADGLLYAGGQLKVDESHLTGESDDVVKEPAVAVAAAGSSSSVQLSSCLLMSGSKVLEGFGRMLVLAVGPNSQQGIIHNLVLRGGTAAASGAEGEAASSSAGAVTASATPMLREATPLTSRLEDVANSIGGVGLAAAVAVLAVNAALYTAEVMTAGGTVLSSASFEAYLSFFITSMTLLVVAVPEGLPLAVTLALAFSVQRMLTDNNLVRNLSSCETMAAATAICSDKTGTLTENNMAVVKLFVGGVTFNVRPSIRSRGAALPAALGAPPAALAAASGIPIIHGLSRSTRSTSSIGASTVSSSSEEEHTETQGVAETKAAAGFNDGMSSTATCLPPDMLTLVSLSWDGEQMFEAEASTDVQMDQQQAAAMADRWQQQQQQAASRLAADNALQNDADEDCSRLLNCNLEVSLSSTSSLFGGPGSSSCSSSVACLSEGLKHLLADSISLNSTASIRLVPLEGATGSSSPAALDSGAGSHTGSSNGGRQLDRSGNRTECALLEFGGRLAGRLLPGAGSTAQQQRVLQVFPFSSTRKRMSSLVAQGLPVSTPGTGTDVQPARLYVKGAAELLLDSCRLQVGLDGQLQPLPRAQIAALKQRCGRGGLRVLALAYRDMLLQPATAEGGREGAVGGGNGNKWQLLDGDEDQGDLVLIGLLGLEDPVRAAVPDAIKDCQRAGIAVRMITGDNAATAASIAAECGILPPDLFQQVEQEMTASRAHSMSSAQHSAQLKQLLAELPLAPPMQQRANNGSSNGGQLQHQSWVDKWLHGLSGSVAGADPAAGLALTSSVAPAPALAVLEGPQFRQLVLHPDGSTNLDAFAALWPHLRVMARCTPADKYTLVQALKALRARGQLSETVAVTGDGTNDAPALNAADVGFAMAAGTSIAKDASDILLLDNNFRSIVSAVKWGRNVYSSVTKFLQFQLTANVVALVTAAGGALALRSSPLSAVQMLWVNLIMDSLASLALATEAPTDAALDEPPRTRDGPIITPTVAKSILGQAGLQLGVLAALLGPLGEALVAAAGHNAADQAAAAAAIAAGADVAAGLTPERVIRYTLVFNSFVLMQLFNQVNSRKIHDEADVLSGLSQQRLFLGILGLEAALQIAIVQWGGRAFSTVPLSASQWGVCIGFGALTLLWRQALRAVPTEPPSSNPPGGPGSGRAGSKTGAAAAASLAAVSAAVMKPVKAVHGLLQCTIGATVQKVAGAASNSQALSRAAVTSSSSGTACLATRRELNSSGGQRQQRRDRESQQR